MQFYKKILWVGLLTLAEGCSPQLSEKFNTVFFTSDAPQTVQLETTSFKYVHTDSMTLARPSRICAIGDGLIAFVENKKSELVWIVDTNTGKFTSCVHKGHGPNETNSISNMWMEGGDLWYASSNDVKIGCVSISKNPLGVTSQTKVHLNFCSLRTISIGNNEFLTQVLEENCRLLRVNDRSEVVDTVGIFPIEDSSEKFEINNAQFQSYIAASPNKQHVVQACITWNKIEIYDAKMSLSNILTGPIEIDSKVIERNLPVGVQWVQSPAWDMFRGLSASNEGFYVGYIGQKFNPDEAERGINTIFFFNWNGDLTKKMILPFEIECFDIDYATNTLFAIVSDPEPHLIMTKIPG